MKYKSATWIEFFLTLALFISVFFMLMERFYMIKSNENTNLQRLWMILDKSAKSYYILFDNPTQSESFIAETAPYTLYNTSFPSDIVCNNCIKIGFNNTDLIISQDVIGSKTSYLKVGVLNFSNVEYYSADVRCYSKRVYEDYSIQICEITLQQTSKVYLRNVSYNTVVIYRITSNLPIYIGNREYRIVPYIFNFMVYRKNGNVVERVYI